MLQKQKISALSHNIEMLKSKLSSATSKLSDAEKNVIRQRLRLEREALAVLNGSMPSLVDGLGGQRRGHKRGRRQRGRRGEGSEAVSSARGSNTSTSGRGGHHSKPYQGGNERESPSSYGPASHDKVEVDSHSSDGTEVRQVLMMMMMKKKKIKI